MYHHIYQLLNNEFNLSKHQNTLINLTALMKILISAYTGLGNMVMKTPMIKTLKEIYPFAQIDLIAGNSFKAESILQGSAYIQQTILLKPEDNHLYKSLAQQLDHDYCLIPFDAAPPFLTKLIRKSKVKRIVRHYHPKENPLQKWKRKAQAKTIWVPLQANRHEIDLNLDLIETIYKKRFNRNRATFISFTKSTSILTKYEIKEPYFVIQPGAANGTDPTKIWQPNLFIELIHALLKTYKHQIIIVGDARDYPKSIKPVMEVFKQGERVINTAGRTSIEEMKNLLFYSNLIICHDSGIMHIADALEKKLIALFGPSDYSRVKPLRKTSHCLFSKTKYLNVKHFFKPFTIKNLSKGEHENYPMSALSAEEVMETVQQCLTNLKVS